MKTFALTVSAILLLSAAGFSQEKNNDQINRQIRSSGVDHFNVSFDPSSNMSKVMAVAENFSDRDADSAGVKAINFAMGFFYPGQSLKSSPESVHFTFWVLTRKPRFGENHHLTIDVDGRSLDLGEARYAAKPAQNMEYLNFELPRADLNIMGLGKNILFNVGTRRFTATAGQINTIRSVAKILGSVGERTF